MSLVKMSCCLGGGGGGGGECGSGTAGAEVEGLRERLRQLELQATAQGAGTEVSGYDTNQTAQERAELLAALKTQVRDQYKTAVDRRRDERGWSFHTFCMLLTPPVPWIRWIACRRLKRPQRGRTLLWSPSRSASGIHPRSMKVLTLGLESIGEKLLLFLWA